MPQGHNIQHLHKRKRATKKEEVLHTYPSKKFWIKFLDRLLLVVAAIAPLTSLPLIFRIYSTQSAGDLSLLTWGLWISLTIPWILYGFVHKVKPIIITNTLWFIIHTITITGIILYS